ncbi:MAG: glutathione synthase, partial [Gammaproteobacteria bacterium]|nr:glutathione synthase [Gammaproteobacteria bacterium]
MKLGVIMDPITGINIKKDSTFAMLLAAQNRGWELHYMEQNDLFIHENRVRASTKILSVKDDPSHWFEFGKQSHIELPVLDAVLMRKDPPFDIEYIYTTYILQFAQAEGLLVINDPAGLRDVNEKMFINAFPDCIAPTIVTRNKTHLTEFVNQHKQAVFKP